MEARKTRKKMKACKARKRQRQKDMQARKPREHVKQVGT